MNKPPLRSLTLALRLFALLGATLGVPAAHANDRPFQYARTAIEEDEEQVWSFESWVQRVGSVRSFSVEPEYVFSSRASLQVEVTRQVDRRDRETGHEAEAEFKYIFNNIARDGWGVGLGVAVAAERLKGVPGTTRSVRLELPLSLSLWEGKGYLHLNVGLDKTTDEKRSWTASAALEREIARRTTLFAEIAPTGDVKYGQVGVRHWLKKERLAVDFSLQQQRSDGERASGFLVGVGWYDL